MFSWHLAPFWLLLLLLPALASAGAEENEWRLKRSKRGIDVYTRPIEGSKYHEFKGVTMVQASMASVLAILDDAPACPRWLHLCKSSRVLTQISETERIFYQVTDLPFPARTRDLVMHAKVTFAEEGSILISMQTRPDHIAKTKYIRIKEAPGSYLLEPTPEGIRLTWIQRANPAGRLPAWLVNRLVKDIPYKSLRAFRRLTQEPPYRDATFKYDDQGRPYALNRPRQ